MNVVLWILQALLAIHTGIGAVWKISNSPHSVPTLSAIPDTVWLILCALEFVAAFFLVIPVIHRKFSRLVIVGALFVALEMLAFMAIHFESGATSHGPVMYWLVVALIAGFIVTGRLVKRAA